MFAKSFVALAAVASLVAAAPIEQRGAPANWAYGYLEDYQTYHVRYLALECYNHKNTDYFQDCCRPMLSTENLQDNRKAYCIPSKADTSAVHESLSGAPAASATASADKASESEYCDTEASASSAAPTNAKVAAAYSSSAAASPSASPAAESKAAVQYIAPVPSTTSTTPAWTPAPQPTTTSTTPAWTPAPAPTTQAAPANSGGEQMTGGYATYFYQGGNPGACGQYHGDNDMIVAIDQARWGSGSFGGGSNTCGKWVTITNTNNGKSVSAMIADVCPTCTNGNSLDLSVGAFRAIANDADGMVPISYHFN